MLGLFWQAAFRKKQPLSTEQLNMLQRAPVLWQSYMPDTEYYERYCQQTLWTNKDLIHPFFWQVKSLSLQLQLLAHPQSPFPLLGMVHLHNRIDAYAECRADIPCEVICRFGTSYQHKKGIATEVIITGTQRGKKVYAATAVFLTRTEKQLDGLASYQNEKIGEDGFAETSHPVAEVESTTRYLGTLGFTHKTVRKYARLSGDFNPIHLTNLSAKLLGFERAIAHGMLSGARAISLLNSQLPLGGEVLEMTFRRPMMLPAQAALYVRQDAEQLALSLRSADPKAEDIFITAKVAGLGSKSAG